jgi:transposase
VAGWDQLTREQLLVVVAEQAKVVEQQALQIEALAKQVAELTRLLKQNSGNSSLPPSSDRGKKPVGQQRRRGSGRKPGKQPGAPGSTLEMVADPDEVIEHVPAACTGCGDDLHDAEPAGVVVRQVRDVPLVKVRVTEHRMHKRACGCGAVTTAPAPAGVDGPACYGPNLRAIAVYLVVYQHVPVERAVQLIADLTGAAPSTGWVSAQIARAADALGDVEALIKTLITLAAVIGVDETSINIAGTAHWLHVARTDTLTAYHCHESRGRKAVNQFGILPAYPGTVVHDALSVYDCYPATHALCGAHLIRELTAAAQAHPDQHWQAQARSALAELADLAAQARADGLTSIPRRKAAKPLQLYRHGVLVGLAEHPRADGRKQTKTRNLLERMRDREAEILRFTKDLNVPFTNNGSERDLRPIKTQLKISGCHRSVTSAGNWLRVRGYISTVRKNGADVLTAIRDAITGNPWTPAMAIPA